jgi:hypothetical protein
MDSKHSPWSAEPDAPGVLIVGTPPRALTGGRAIRTSQPLYLAMEATRHDFPHTVRRALAREWSAALDRLDLDAQQRTI